MTRDITAANRNLLVRGSKVRELFAARRMPETVEELRGVIELISAPRRATSRKRRRTCTSGGSPAPWATATRSTATLPWAPRMSPSGRSPPSRPIAPTGWCSRTTNANGAGEAAHPVAAGRGGLRMTDFKRVPQARARQHRLRALRRAPVGGGREVQDAEPASRTGRSCRTPRSTSIRRPSSTTRSCSGSTTAPAAAGFQPTNSASSPTRRVTMCASPLRAGARGP